MNSIAFTKSNILTYYGQLLLLLNVPYFILNNTLLYSVKKNNNNLCILLNVFLRMLLLNLKTNHRYNIYGICQCVYNLYLIVNLF